MFEIPLEWQLKSESIEFILAKQTAYYADLICYVVISCRKTRSVLKFILWSQLRVVDTRTSVCELSWKCVFTFKIQMHIVVYRTADSKDTNLLLLYKNRNRKSTILCFACTRSSLFSLYETHNRKFLKNIHYSYKSIALTRLF